MVLDSSLRNIIEKARHHQLVFICSINILPAYIRGLWTSVRGSLIIIFCGQCLLSSGRPILTRENCLVLNVHSRLGV